jgi:hypothetical protein
MLENPWKPSLFAVSFGILASFAGGFVTRRRFAV